MVENEEKSEVIIMTEFLAVKIADKIVGIGAVAKEKYEVIKFGLELLISSIIGILIVAIISTVAGQPFAWIFFLAAFIPLRTTAGGYHASTHLRCNIVFAITYVVCLFFVEFMLFPVVSYLLSSVASALVIFAFSPIEAKNKPLNDTRKKKNRIKSIIVISIDIVIAIILLVFDIRNDCIQMYFLGVIAATVSQIVALIIYKKEKTKNENKTHKHHYQNLGNRCQSRDGCSDRKC